MRYMTLVVYLGIVFNLCMYLFYFNCFYVFETFYFLFFNHFYLNFDFDNFYFLLCF